MSAPGIGADNVSCMGSEAMKRIEDPEFDSLMARWKALGVVLECVPFALEGADGGDRGVHRAVALATLECVKEHYNAWWDRVVALSRSGKRPRWSLPRMEVDPDALGEGESIDKAGFLGCGIDLVGRRLLVRGRTTAHLNHMFWSGDREAPENCVPFPLDGQWRATLSHAFLDPPYPLSGTSNEQSAAFFTWLDMLFDGLQGDCVIFRWSDASSNYFEEGRDWWGTYFWTVHAAGTDRIVGLVASTSD